MKNNKIIEALQKVGININSIYDLVNTNKSYPEAIPVLIQLLRDGLQNDRDKEGIIRALAVPEAKGKIGKLLIKEFYKIPNNNMILRWVIGNTMNVVISKEDIDDVIKIVENKLFGMSRQMFTLALGNIFTERSEEVLIKSLNDAEIAPHAIAALGKLKSKKAKDKIIQLTKHPNSLIKKEAKNALKKINS